MGRSPHDLLKASIAPRARDDNSSVLEGPDHVAADPGLALKRAVAIPHRRLKRIHELVAARPPLDAHKLTFINLGQPDRGGVAATPRTPPERHDSQRRAASLELGPYVVTTEQLVPCPTEPRRVDARGRASRRARATHPRRRFARRAAASAPTPGDMQTPKRRGSLRTAPRTQPPSAAAGPDSRATLRARLFQPRTSAAHVRPREPDRTRAADCRIRREVSRLLARRAELEGTAKGTTTRAMRPTLACADPPTRPAEPARGQPHPHAATGETPGSNGEGGIRTPNGPMAHTGFRDRYGQADLERVHSASTRFTSCAAPAPRASIPKSRNSQDFRTLSLAFVYARHALKLPW